MLNARLIVAVCVLAIAAVMAAAMPLTAIAAVDPLSGFTICSSSSASLTPTFLSYAPNPPVGGKPLILTVKGKLTKTVDNSKTANATVTVSGTKFGIQVFSQSFNICDNVKCPYLPTDNGTLVLNITLPDIPSQFKGQTVNLKAIGTNGDGSQVVCLQNANFKA